MPILSLEKTTAAILHKFKNLSEFEKRKIVFWYDNEKTAEEEDLESISKTLSQNGIKTLILDNNFYEIKKLIEHTDTESDYLIYSHEAERPYKENWLLDIQLYSERFENSRISDIKSEIGIEGYEYDKFLEKHQKFFASKKRVAAFKKFYDSRWKEKDLLKGIFTVITGSTAPDDREIVKNVLMNSLSEEENTIWEDIVRYSLEEKFWDLAGRNFGFYKEHPTLEKFFLSFLITHIDRNAQIPPGALESYINNPKQSNECEIFISGWMENSKDYSRFDEYCRKLLLEEDKKLEKDLTSILNKQKVESYLEVNAPDIFDKSIIRQIVKTIENGGRDYEKYLEWIEARKTRHYYSEFKHIYSALKYGIMLIRLSEEIEEKETPANTPNELFRRYAEKYYLHDYYYRKFYRHYDKNSDKDILKNSIREIVEREYRNTNEKILTKWSDLLEKNSNGKWEIELIDKQKDFFDNHVSKIIKRNDRDKVAVIISDALRYEVAAELMDVLNKSTNGTVEMKTMASSLPSYTRLAMASLLPHKQLEYKKDHVFVDGMDSDGLANRDKILAAYGKESIALNFKEFSKQKSDEQRELIKGKRIVYIYHNRIDDTGDSKSSEDEVFEAAELAIDDINTMINRLGRSLNVNNIIITADHGFIYNRDALENVDIVDTAGFEKDNFLIANKRFIISSEKTELPNTHRFELNIPSDSGEHYYIYTPFADLRFRLQGGGRNFVHGGSSLQEIVIPVLHYNHIKSESDLDRKGIGYGKVGLTLLGNIRKITSNPFRISLLQTESVTDKREPLRCRIALYDNKGERLSDEKVIIADRTSDEPDKRIIDVTLTLGRNVKNGIYLLKAVDEDIKAKYTDVLETTLEVDILITDDF